MKNFRDIETLSAYLDGQLNTSDAARLEARLKTDPELASVMNDLRAARGILRKLPARKAPRNFTLTRQMVGLKPPLPRTYPLFRLATAFAAILFLFSFTATTLVPMLSFGGAAAPAATGGYGMGGGGGCEEPCGGGDAAMQESAAATELPAAAPEESFSQEALPTMTANPPAADMAPLATTEDSTRIMETPSAKVVPTESANQPEVQKEPSAPSVNWTMLFLVITLLGMVALWVMRFTSRNKWR